MRGNEWRYAKFRRLHAPLRLLLVHTSSTMYVPRYIHDDESRMKQMLYAQELKHQMEEKRLMEEERRAVSRGTALPGGGGKNNKEGRDGSAPCSSIQIYLLIYGGPGFHHWGSISPRSIPTDLILTSFTPTHTHTQASTQPGRLVVDHL